MFETNLQETFFDAVVIGGGIAGLTAAVRLGRAGRRTLLLERAPRLGGRADTADHGGYRLNLGPHALYRDGHAARTFAELGVSVAGANPVNRLFLVRNGKIYAPSGAPLALLLTGAIEFGAKIEAARFLMKLGKPDPAPLDRVTVDDWLATAVRRPDTRMFMKTFIRLSTYASATDRMSAGAIVRQLQTGQKGVLYLHDGWKTLVDGLAQRATEVGVEILTNAGVETVARRPEGFEIRLTDARRCAARAVIVAGSPALAAKLFPESETLRTAAERAIPVTAACLDLAFRRLPVPTRTGGLGLDRPLYYSVHSAAASLAPTGGAVLHAAFYRAPENNPSHADIRRELETMLDAAQPGWRAEIVHERFMPALTVGHWLPTAETGGLAGRPSPVVADTPGVYIAGDWVGDTGMLVDASTASGTEAAERLKRDQESGIRDQGKRVQSLKSKIQSQKPAVEAGNFSLT